MEFKIFGIDKWSIKIVGIEGLSIEKKIVEEMKPWIVESSRNPNINKLNIICKPTKNQDKFVLNPDYQLEIYYSNKVALFHNLRRAIREGLYYLLEEDGWIQVHAGAISLAGDGIVIFTGDKGAGKTSSVLASCDLFSNVNFMSNDRILINPHNNWAIGWPTAIGIGEETLKRIKTDLGEGDNYNGKQWYWSAQLRDAGVLMIPSGKIKLIVSPKFDLNSNSSNSNILVKNNDPNSVIEGNVRKDALSESNVWNISRPSYENYGDWVRTSKWISEIKAISIQSPGLCQPYMDTLKKEFV